MYPDFNNHVFGNCVNFSGKKVHNFDCYSVYCINLYILLCFCAKKSTLKELEQPKCCKICFNVVCTFVLQCRRVYKSACMVEDDCECSESPLTCENNECVKAKVVHA